MERESTMEIDFNVRVPYRTAVEENRKVAQEEMGKSLLQPIFNRHFARVVAAFERPLTNVEPPTVYLTVGVRTPTVKFPYALEVDVGQVGAGDMAVFVRGIAGINEWATNYLTGRAMRKMGLLNRPAIRLATIYPGNVKVNKPMRQLAMDPNFSYALQSAYFDGDMRKLERQIVAANLGDSLTGMAYRLGEQMGEAPIGNGAGGKMLAHLLTGGQSMAPGVIRINGAAIIAAANYWGTMGFLLSGGDVAATMGAMAIGLGAAGALSNCALIHEMIHEMSRGDRHSGLIPTRIEKR